MRETKVLGMVLSEKRWEDNRAAVLSFCTTPEPHWTNVQLNVLALPTDQSKPHPKKLAQIIHEFARKNGIAAIALAGPQGWRHPTDRTKGEWLTKRGGKGRPRHACQNRLCEYQTSCWGDNGTPTFEKFEKNISSSKYEWNRFCIEVFSH